MTTKCGTVGATVGGDTLGTHGLQAQDKDTRVKTGARGTVNGNTGCLQRQKAQRM